MAGDKNYYTEAEAEGLIHLAGPDLQTFAENEGIMVVNTNGAFRYSKSQIDTAARNIRFDQHDELVAAVIALQEAVKGYQALLAEVEREIDHALSADNPAEVLEAILRKVRRVWNVKKR